MQSKCKNEECPITLDAISTLSPKNIIMGSDGVCYNKDALKIHFTTSIKNREKRIGQSISIEDRLRYPNGQPCSLKDISDIGLNYKKLIRPYYTKEELDRAINDASADMANNMYDRVYTMLIRFGLDRSYAREYAESDERIVYHHAIEEGDFTTEYEDILFNHTRDGFITTECEIMQSNVYRSAREMRLDDRISRGIAGEAYKELENFMITNDKLTDQDKSTIFENAIKKMEEIVKPAAKPKSWFGFGGRKSRKSVRVRRTARFVRKSVRTNRRKN
jgi:hypothetical protein